MSLRVRTIQLAIDLHRHYDLVTQRLLSAIGQRRRVRRTHPDFEELAILPIFPKILIHLVE